LTTAEKKISVKVPHYYKSNIQSSTVQRPRIPTFSGDQKGETTFKVWKLEVKCIIREGDYSDVVGILSRSRYNFDVGGGLLGPWSNSTFTLALGELCFHGI
jgi:hypothetical protein